MNEVEYILRIVLKARDDLASSLAAATTKLKAFTKAIDEENGKLHALNESLERMDTNVQNVTDKFEAWRAVISGVSKDTDDTRKSFGQLGKEVNATNKEVERQIAAQKKVAEEQRKLIKSADALRSEYRRLTEQEHKSNVERDYALWRLKEIGSQLEKFAKQVKDPDIGRFWYRWSQESKQAADSISADIARTAKEEKDALALAEKAMKDSFARRGKDHESYVKTYNNLVANSIKQQIDAEERAAKESLRIETETARRRQEIRDRDRAAYEASTRARAVSGRLGRDPSAMDVSEARRSIEVLRRLANQYGDTTKMSGNLRTQAEELNRTLANSTRLTRDHARSVQEENQAQAEAAKVTQEVTQARAQQAAGLARLKQAGDLGLIDRASVNQTIDDLNRLRRSEHLDRDEKIRLRAEADELGIALRNSGRDAEHTGGWFSKMAHESRNSREGVAQLDNQMRGLGLLILIGFGEQLITVLEGLAGELLAVAGSAAQAAAALGGMAAAAVGQALPSIGLLGAAMFRVKGVFDAVNQAQLLQQQQYQQGDKAAKKSADASESLRVANKRLQDAQENLTEARKKAREDLEDLIQAENDAKLAAIGAALSQKEAQEALIKAQATGDTAGIQRAQLQVLQANNDARQKEIDLKRKSAEADRGRRGGPEGMKEVQDAKDAVAEASHGIDTAKRNAAETAAGMGTAASKLNFLLSQMSTAEKRLYTAVTNLQRLFRQGIYRDITDVLINSFARSIERITKIIQMPEVLRLARGTARALATQMNRIFDAFTAKPVLDQFLRIGEEGRKNLQPLASIVIRVGKALINIAEEAGPAFRNFIDYIGDLAGKFLGLTDNKKSMEDFFTAGEKHLEAWIDLFLAIIELFAALTGAGGAESGLKTIEDATAAIEGLTKKVRANKGDVADFFENARQIAYDVMDVVVALAKELHGLFTPENSKRFADLLTKVIIPALGDAFEWISKVTTLILKVADTPLGGELIKFLIAAVFLAKILSSTFGGFKLLFGPFKVLAGLIFEVGEGIGAIIALEPALAMAFLPWIALVAVIVLILAKLGLLDDAWRAVKGAFTAFWKEVQPSMRRLFKAVGELWDAIKEGKGAFAILRPAISILRTVIKAVIDIGAIFFRVFGRTIGRIIGGAIDILTGIITFLTGVFTGDWRKAWSGIRQIVRGFIRGFTAIFRALPELFLEIGKKILPAMKRGIEGLWHWLEGLPERLSKLAGKAGNAFVKGLVGGLKMAGGVAKDIANAFVDLLNHMLPDKITVPGAPDIKLPKNPIPHFATGGEVGGSGRGDRQHIMAEAGEFVVRKDAVERYGLAFFEFLNRGKGDRSGRFQTGGQVQGGGGGSLTISFQGGNLDDFASAWREFWSVLVTTSRRATNVIERDFREMRVNTTRSAGRMYRDVRGSLADIQQSFSARGDRILKSWSRMWDDLKRVAFDGLYYIAQQTNRALKGLGEDVIDFNLTLPKKSSAGKARGGFIGSQGQRGRDSGFYALGAGEAVLNWAHQKYVAPAVEAYYGHPFSEMFNRVRGYHAGGPEQRGFAGGREGTAALFDGHPSNVVSGLISILRILKKRFPGILVTSTRDHGAVTSTGGLSDHPSGHAMDIASGDYGLMNRVAAYIKSSGIAHRLKQGIHNPNLSINQGETVPTGFWAQAWGQHANHIHLAMAGALGKVAEFITNIGRAVVKGNDGALKNFVQAALDKTRKVANQMLDSKATAGADAAGQPGQGTPAPKGQHRKWIIAGLRLAGVPATEANIAAQYALDMGESSGNPKAIQQVHDINSVTGNLARGIAQVIPPTFNTYKVPGHDDIMNPVDNIAASANYQIARYGHLVGHSGYARGGEIPGPDGMPIPILAHAQEWVLNKAQQARIAAMLGTSRNALRSMLGFWGPSTTAQGGIEATEIDPLTTKEVKGIDSRGLRRFVVALRRISRSFAAVSADIGSVEEWSGFLGVTLQDLKRVTRRIHAKKNERKTKDTDFDRGIAAFADAVDGMLSDTIGMFAKLRASIERRANVAARRLLRRQFRVGRGGIVSRRDAGTEEQIAETIAGRELEEQRRQRPELVAERNEVARALRQVRRQQRRRGLSQAQKQRLQGQETQLQGMLDDARQRVTDNVSSIYEAQQAYLQAQVATQQTIADNISKIYDRANAANDLIRRTGTALGREDLIDRANRAQRDLLTRQANELEARLGQIRGINTPEAQELANQIADQVADLRTQIFESIQQELHDAVDRINARAARRTTRLDLANRMLDAVGAVGLSGVAGLAGERFTRAGVFAQRGGVLARQQTELRGVLARAQAAPADQRNVQLINDLNDQLAELEVAIKENSKALFDAKTEAINQRASLVTTQSDLRTQIINLTGQISGNTDQAALLAEAQIKAAALAEQQRGLQAQLDQAIADKNQAGIDDLTTQLLQNQVAILENTVATNELTGNLSKDQGFTTTAWDLFRQAIFTGSGGLLPQYQNLFPSAQAGAMVARSGALMVHAGETVVPAQISKLDHTSVGGDTNVYDIDIHEAGRPIDWRSAATNIMFAKSGAK